MNVCMHLNINTILNASLYELLLCEGLPLCCRTGEEENLMWQGHEYL